MARIILVEDDELVRETTEELLEVSGHEVVLSAMNGDIALKGAATITDPDLAIVDLSLPDTDGDRLAAVLRERFPGLALIISSGRKVKPDDLDLDPARLCILQKPYDIEALEQAVREVLDA